MFITSKGVDWITRAAVELLDRIKEVDVRKGGALSGVRAQCNYLGVWPY